MPHHIIIIETSAFIIKACKVIAAKSIFTVLGNVPYKEDKGNPGTIIIECTQIQRDKINKLNKDNIRRLEIALNEL